MAEIVFALDSSGSIGIDNWLLVLNFTKNVIRGFTVGPNNVKIGLLYYGNYATLAFHLDEHNSTEDLLTAIDRIPWKDQKTNTSGAIRVMREEMFTARRG